MSANPVAREFLTAMFERRPDPYEGAELDTSRRVTAALLGLSTLLALCFLPLQPPDHPIGWVGWPVTAAILLAGFTGTALLLRRRPGFDDLLAVAYAGVGGVGVLEWLAGGGAPVYSHLLLFWLGAGAVHPPRRAFTHLAALVAVLWLPGIYGRSEPSDPTELVAQSLLLLAIGSVLISYLFQVRRQRIGLRAGAEVARRLARIDSLTGLANRRALDETLTVEVSRSARQGQPLAVGMVDLDGLKRINERLGHFEGDRCLQEAARAMERSLRGSDLCFRWGGDEFVVVLPGTGRADAEAVLSRMAETVEGVCGDAGERGLTLSYGVAELPEGGSPEDLLALADLTLMEQQTERRR
jgi:diguanylate cyclase (GGDEF)-like protein